MNERQISLDPAERQFLAHAIAADEIWPPREDLGRLLDQVPDGDHAGGPRLRATLLALALRGGDEGERTLELSPGELWLIDTVLQRRDLRREKLPDGRPLAEFAAKIWELILDVHEQQLPHDVQKGQSMPETKTPTRTPAKSSPAPRPYFDPGTVREPRAICPQQRREEGWEAI